MSISRDAIARIVNDTRTFAFIDVLGYADILTAPRFTDSQRVAFITQLWENLLGAVQIAKADYPDVDTVLFSDSLYAAHVDPLVVTHFVASLYANVATYYTSHPEDWMPWLRGGIAMGWALDVHDPTVPFNAPNPQDCYRNPVGPGPARAYHLAERTLRGARVLVERATCINIEMSCRGVAADAPIELRHAVTTFRDRWPSAGSATVDGTTAELYDLPWWRLLDRGHTRALELYTQHTWQIDTSNDRAVAHRDATLALLRAGG